MPCQSRAFLRCPGFCFLYCLGPVPDALVNVMSRYMSDVSEASKLTVLCLVSHVCVHLRWSRATCTSMTRHGAVHIPKCEYDYAASEQAFYALQLCKRVLATIKPSVRHTRVLWQNERKFCRHSYTIWKFNSSSFRTRRKNGWWETSPSTWNFGPNWPLCFKNGDLQSIFAHSASALTPSKKVHIWLIAIIIIIIIQHL